MAKRHARKQTIRHPSARPLLRKPPSVVTLGVVSSVSEHKVQPTPVKTGTGPPKGMLPPEMEWYVKEDGTWGTRLKSQFRDSKPVPVKVRTPIMEDKYYNPIRPKTEPKQGYVWAKASPFITGVDSITGLPLRGSISYPGGEVPNYIYLQVPEQFATATSTGLWEYGYKPLPTPTPSPTPKPILVPTPSPTPMPTPKVKIITIPNWKSPGPVSPPMPPAKGKWEEAATRGNWYQLVSSDIRSVDETGNAIRGMSQGGSQRLSWHWIEVPNNIKVTGSKIYVSTPTPTPIPTIMTSPMPPVGQGSNTKIQIRNSRTGEIKTINYRIGSFLSPQQYIDRNYGKYWSIYVKPSDRTTKPTKKKTRHTRKTTSTRAGITSIR